METNIVTITNIVWQVNSGVVPVSVQLDWNYQVWLFIAGFNAGFPLAVGWFAVMVVMSAVRSRSYFDKQD